MQRAADELEFVELPRLSTTEVADVLQVVRVRIVRYLERRGVVEAGDELTVLDDDLVSASRRWHSWLALAVNAIAGRNHTDTGRCCDARPRREGYRMPATRSLDVLTPDAPDSVGIKLGDR